MRLACIAFFLALFTPACMAQSLVGHGSPSDGAGMSFGQFDDDPRPDLAMMIYHGDDGPNMFRYRVSWNLGPDGLPEQLNGIVRLDGVGHTAEGAGIAVVQLDGDPRPEIILMAYDAPEGPNEFRYRVALNVDPTGLAPIGRITGIRAVPGVGDRGDGAGAAVGQIDNNPRPDLILMAYDAPEGPNEFRYRVVYNLDDQGRPARISGAVSVQGVGDQADGAGIVITQIDGNPRPDLILMAYDAPSGRNEFRYRVALNIDPNGVPGHVAGPFIVEGVSSTAQGAGLAIGQLDGDPEPNLMLMAYSPAADGFRYFFDQFNLTTSETAFPDPPTPPTGPIWSESRPLLFDGIPCASQDFGFSGCPAGEGMACSPQGAICAEELRDVSNGCRVSTRQCE